MLHHIFRKPPTVQTGQPTYWLTRFVILRLLGMVYAVAFLVAINQVIPLIGANGLTPVNSFVKLATNSLGSAGACFVRLPSIFWFMHSDAALLTAAWAGFALSLVVVAGFANAIVMAVLWLLYMSFVNIGQEWYGYGWEIQLLETGFLAIFLCPLVDARPFPKREPPMAVIALFRWLIFRIMLGAGLIKLRGDDVWRNATALYYHFETQPIPGPLSRWLHFLPRGVLRFGVWYNWLAELAAPLFVLWPRIGRHIAGCIIIGFQAILIASGNLSFLNWLTVVPALACFDDVFFAKLLPKALVRKATAAIAVAVPSKPMRTTAWVVTVTIIYLSIQPVANMVSPNQVMNTSFDPLDLVNTYGAFGSVGKERLNVVFEGTYGDTTGGNAHWIAYPYKGLPVALDKQPPQIAPYHLRFDWQMWFASMGTPDQYPWVYTLVAKLLHNDDEAISLFASNPFHDRPPRFIRAVLYRYSFAQPGNRHGFYWSRQALGFWLPAMGVDDVRLKE